jgi:hypothetical protein
MILQQDDESVPNNFYENEPVVGPTEQDVSNIINVGNLRFVTSNKEVVDKFLEDGLDKNT